MLEAPLVLKWWLGIVPEHTVDFLRLILCASMLVTLSRPLVTSVHATGQIKKFQFIEGSPEYVFGIHIIIEILTQYARVIIVLPMISMKKTDYLKEVVIPILKVLIITPILPLLTFNYMDKSVSSFFIVCFISVLSVLLGGYFLGCTKLERSIITNKILKKIKKGKPDNQ